MPSQQDLTLAVLFKAIEDGTFKRVVRRLTTLLTGLNSVLNKTNIAAAQLNQSSKNLSNALNKTGKSASTTGKQIGTLTSGINKLYGAFRVTASYFLASRLFYALTEGASAGIREIIEFDQALHNLAAISGATSGELESMKDVILETAERTKYSTTEIAEGMILLTQAGLSAGEAVSTIGAVADLAAGTLTNLAVASDLVTTTLRAFQINAAETRRIADVMASAINKSKLTIDKLRIAFNYVGAGAHQAGLSLERTAQQTMILANNGMRASTIGTGLRQILSRLLSPNKKLREAMGAYGLELDKATGNSGWFGDQLMKLASVMYNFKTQTVDMAKAYELFGLRGAQSAAILIDSFMDLNGVWDKTYEEATRTGMAQKMMEEQSKGLAFKIKNLTDLLGNLAITMGDAGFSGSLKIAIDLLRDFTKALITIFGTTFGKFIINAGLATAAVYTLVGAFKALLYIGPMVKSALALLITPIGLIGIAIGSIIGIIATWIVSLNKAGIQAAKIVAEQQGLIKSLKYYREQLKEVEVGSEEYLRVIEQLKQAHPELAKEVDLVVESYEDLDKILEEVQKKAELKALEGNVQQLSILSRALAVTRDDFEYFSKTSISFREKFPDFKTYTDEVEGFHFGIGKLGTILDTLDITVTSLARHFKELNVDTIAGITIALKDLIDEHGEGLEYNTEELNYLVKLIKDRLSDFDRWSKEAANRQRKAMAEIVKQLPDDWIKVFHKLSAIEKTHFVQTIESTKNGWENIKNTVEKYVNIIYGSNKAAAEAAIKAMEKAYFDEKLSQFFVKQQRRLIEVPENWREAYEKAGDELKFGLSKAFNEAKSAWGKELEWHEKHNRKKGESNEEFYARMSDIQQKFFDKRLKEYDDLLLKEEYKIEKILDRIDKVYERYSGSKYATEKAKAESHYNEIERLIERTINDEQRANEIKLKNKEAYYERLKRMARIHGFNTPEERKAFEEETGEKTDETYGVTSADKLAEMWRKSGENLKMYTTQLDVLRKEGKITFEEHERVMKRSFSAPGEAFASGWEAAMDRVRSGSEFLYDLAEQLPERLADGFVDAWDEFMSGTKSASEAFADFARSTLKWLAQMIMKFMIMRAMQSAMGFFGGGPAGPAHIGAGGTTAFGMHSGGIIGKDRSSFTKQISNALLSVAPRLHNGINNRLKANEYPAILEKNEGVFTKEQMKALSMGAGGTSISVPVNISDAQNADILKRHMPDYIEEAVLKVMRKYTK